MKAAAIEQDIIRVFTETKKPLSIKDIAEKSKTQRHKVNFVINALKKTGQIEVISESGTPMFVYRSDSSHDADEQLFSEEKQSVIAAKESPTAPKISSLASKANPLDPEVLMVLRHSDAPMSVDAIAASLEQMPHKVRPALARLIDQDLITGSAEDGFSYKSAMIGQSLPVMLSEFDAAMEMSSEQEGDHASAPAIPIPMADNPLVTSILRFIMERPAQVTDIEAHCPGAEEVLKEMESHKLVEGSKVWRGSPPIYEIQALGLELLKLKGFMMNDGLSVIEVMPEETSQDALEETLEPSLISTTQPEEAIEEPEDKSILMESAIKENPASPESAKPAMDRKIMDEIQLLVEKLVDKRMAESKKQEAVSESLRVSIGQGITEVTHSLQDAINSLNKLSDLFNQMD